MMTPEWMDDAVQREKINEGFRSVRYLDTLGIPTVGYGYNCTRGPAPLIAAGIHNAVDIIAGTQPITPAQAESVMRNDIAAAVIAAAASLNPGVYNSLTEARQFVVMDLVYNMGETAWLQFVGTRAAINLAQAAKSRGDLDYAHQEFVQAGTNLSNSAYYNQTGDRAKRNVDMLVSGVYQN